ncbi:MAG: winged helix-turn-helix transcriptional regulator [Nitrososphaerota archaeon]|nr:winged helix-turn-helix transcriptional regulator [Nitrososphaerota archaeon]
MLDTTDILVLDELSRSPLATHNLIGEATGLSQSGVAGRISALVSDEFLSDRYARAQVSYPAVGLEPVLVFVESKYTGWAAFEKACDLHPYTQLRIRCMGAVNGFFAVFAVPQGSKMLLIEFMEGLVRSGAVSSYKMLDLIAEWGHSETRFKLFDPATKRWRFDWNEWESQVLSSPSELGQPRPSVLHELDPVDIKILRILSKDAKLQRLAIAREVGVRDYEMSRRLKFLMEGGAVSYHRLVHETGIMGVEMTVLMRCRARVDVTGKFVNATPLLPYQGSIYPVEDGFVLLLNMPSGEVSKLAELLSKRCESVDLMWGDYASSMKYYFDNEPTNFDGEKWRADRGFMVESPLRSAPGGDSRP